MDGNLIIAGIGTAAGLWGIAITWDRRRKPPAQPMPPPHILPVPIQLEKLDAIVAELPNKIEQGLRPVLNQAIERNPPPLVLPPMPDVQALIARMERFESQVALSNQFIDARHEELCERLKDLSCKLVEEVHAVREIAATPPPPPPQSDIIPILEDVMARMDRVALQLTKATGIEPPQRRPHSMRSLARNPNPVKLQMFNTVSVLEFTAVKLVPPEADIYLMSIMNLGPGTLWVRDSEEVDIDDPLSTTVPPGGGDNEIHVPASLYFAADDGGAMVSVRLSHAV